MANLFNWKNAALAGIIAGIVFMMLEMVLVGTVGGQSPWGPPRMIAAIGMGEGVLPPPATFDATIFVVAMVIHFVLAILLGVILGWVISNWRLSLPTALIVGIIFGLLVYAVNFYGFTALFPWFAMARGAISILAHAAFGLVLAGVYHAMTRRDVTVVTE